MIKKHRLGKRPIKKNHPLLSAYSDCNTYEGKKIQFPVKKEYCFLKTLSSKKVKSLRNNPNPSKKWNKCYYLQPRDLNKIEEPLPLHPHFDNPEEHLGFDLTGEIFPRETPQGMASEKGKHSIQVYNLNTESLCVERQEAQSIEVSYYMMAYLGEKCEGKSPEEAEQIAWGKVKNRVQRKGKYSAVVLEGVKLKLKNLGKIFNSNLFG